MEVNKRIVIGMVALGAIARLLPHPWNFTPLVAIGLYAAAKSSKLRTGILTTVLALLIGDAVMGFYQGMLYIYAALLIPVLAGRFIKDKNGVGPIAAGGVFSSLAFFLSSNLVAFFYYYPHTTAGLAACYVAAIPFYRNQLLADAIYTVALFGGHALIQRLTQPSPRTA